MTTAVSRPSRRSFLALTSLAAVSATALAACDAGSTSGKSDNFKALAAKTGDPEVKSIKYQGSAGSVTLSELAQDLGYLDPISLHWVGNTISGPQDIQSAATKQTDVGGAFNGAVAKLIGAGAPITSVISMSGLTSRIYNGFFTLDGSSIRTAKDLIGKKVGMNTLGAQSEATMDIYLQRHGLSKSEIKRVEPIVVPPLNTEESLRKHQIDVGVLGGILQDKALATGGIRQLFSDYSTLGAVDLDVYVFRNDFIQANPVTVRHFVTAVAQAIEWARVTPLPEVIDRFTTIINKRKRNEDTSPLKYFKGYAINAKGGVVAPSEFSTWITWLEQQGQLPKGKLTADHAFTNAFNPYAGPKPPTTLPSARPA